jgi:hypothetical protein
MESACGLDSREIRIFKVSLILKQDANLIPITRREQMAKFLIEVPHDKEVLACAQVVDSFLNYGSHFVINADWGCMDGIHKAWITIETDNKEDARNILPPGFRTNATITKLNKFTREEIDEILKSHGKK